MPTSKSMHLKKTPNKLDVGRSCSSGENNHSVDGLRSNSFNAFMMPVFQVSKLPDDDSSMR